MSTYARIQAAKDKRTEDQRLNDVAYLGTTEGQAFLEARNRELAKARRER